MEPIKKKYHYPADLSHDLLEKGIEILQDRGPDGLTLKTLAASLNVTSAAMYHHYADKTALLVAIVERRLDELKKELDDKAYKPFLGDTAKMFVKGAMVFYDFCEDHCEFLSLMTGDAIRSWDEYPTIKDRVNEILKTPLAAIKEGQKKGSIRSGSPESLALMAFSGAYGFLNVLFNSKTDLPADLLKNARRTFFEVICGSVNTLKNASDPVKNDMQVFEKTFVG